RRRHTRFSRDWSSDVCSSDLWLFDTWKDDLRPTIFDRLRRRFLDDYRKGLPLDRYVALRSLDFAEFPTEWILEREEVTRDDVARSEERRVGKGGRYRVLRGQ